MVVANSIYALTLLQLPQWLGAIWIEAPADKAVEAVKLMEKLAADTYDHLKVCRGPMKLGYRKLFKLRCTIWPHVGMCS